MPRENLLSLFGEFQRYGDDVAIVQHRGYRRESWTYNKLASKAVACALELKERGVRTGERVLLWGPNSAEWMGAFWGCLLRGAVAVPMDDGATPEFASRVARDASVRFIFASREKRNLDPAIPALVLEELPDTLKRAYIHVSTHNSARPGVPLYATLADEPLTRNHIAQILFTSGTTAEPRGVVLTHGNFLANLEPLERGIDEYRKYERWFHPLRFVTLVPLSHVFGQFMALFVPPLLGAAVVFEPSANPTEIFRTVKRERATALISVPRMLDGLKAGIERDFEARGKSNRFKNTFDKAKGRKFLRRAWMFRHVHRRFGWKFWAFISGGAALSNETEEFFRRMGYAVVQGYGMTETASLISLNHPFRSAEGSVGKILPGREFRLAEDGEILVRGENVAAGYWQAGALQPSSQEGWLRTGDLGELDAEGNLRFRGRKKNVIVTPAGLNVYPEDLEAALRRQRGVRDCVVIPFERGGNAEPCAVLLMEPVAPNGEPRSGWGAPAGEPRQDAAREVVEAANASLAEYQRIRTWMVWPEFDFPRTATGKPRLGEISARASRIFARTTESQEAATTAFEPPSGSLDDLLSRFTISASTQQTGKSASSSTSFTSSASLISLSSLDRVELLSALEEKFHVELNETAFSDAQTVADVEQLLQQPTARRSEYIYPRWTRRELIRWLRLMVYYALVWPSTQILGHPRIVGREHLRNVSGPVLVISNHITRRADIGLILAALPMRFRHRLAIAMGGETLQDMRRPPREWLFVRRWAYRLGYWLVTALFNVFPLPRFSGFRESFRFAGESVDQGYSVLVFPEGEVNNSEDGRMAAFQSGIGLLAENLRIPIVPMRLDGVWKMKRERRRLARFGEITVRIGAPVTFPPGTSPGEIARRLESLVRSL
jgi:long-chain acyl-CoA synthetase